MGFTMKFSEIKEKLLRNKFSIGFENSVDGIYAVVNAPIFDTNFVISIGYFDGECDALTVNYNCTNTGKTRFVQYFYLKDFINDYENFLEFLGAKEPIEKDYNYVFGIVKDICMK